MRFFCFITLFCAFWFFSAKKADARIIEISAMGSYSRTNYGNNNYSTSKRYSGSVGLYVTPISEIEVAYTFTESFVNYDPVQTTKTRDQVLSATLVQMLVPANWFFQPYIKVGGAQYNREQQGTAAGVPTPAVSSKSPSGVAGAGLRIFLLRNFSLKIEGVTYLPSLKTSEAKNNFSIQGGISVAF